MDRRNSGTVTTQLKATRQSARWGATRKIAERSAKFAIGEFVRMKNGTVRQITGIGHIGYHLEGMAGEFRASDLEPAEPP